MQAIRKLIQGGVALRNKWTREGSWLRKGFWAILDQGLFAGTNFLVNILLARWLPEAEYGAFTVAYSAFLLLAAFHTATLTEPMLVFGAGKYAKDFRKYLGVLLCGHAGLSAIISLGLAGAALLLWQFGSAILAQALFGLVIASPFILLLWLLRRAFYVQFQPQWAATGGGIYLLLMLAGMYGLYKLQWISSISALVVMGVAGVIVGMWLTNLLRPLVPSTATNPTPRMILAGHWGYGRWSIATVILTWIPSNIYYTVLPIWFGLESAAALRAMMNLVMPILHLNSAISVLLLPQFSKAFQARGKTGLRCPVRSALAFFLAGAILYWSLLVLFHSQAVDWLYDGQYGDQSGLLVLIGGIPVSAGVVSVLGGALRAMEHPDQVFWCYVASSLVALTLGLLLLASEGLVGATAGLLTSSIATASVMAWFHIRQRQVEDTAQ